jgi:hypothetical protein
VAKKNPTAREENRANKLRTWRVTILRNRAEFLGVVQAADERAAEKAAIEASALDEDRCKQLAVREEMDLSTESVELICEWADRTNSLREVAIWQPSVPQHHP